MMEEASLNDPCPLCRALRGPVLAEAPLAVAFEAPSPVAPGHVLVLPRRHAPSFFACTVPEQRELLALVEAVRARRPELSSSGATVTFDAGAGGPFTHAHVHLVPAVPGHPERLELSERLTDGDGDGGGHFYDALAPLLARATKVDILAAFVQASGLELINGAIQAALQRGARVRLLTGDYLDITQAQALRQLADWMGSTEAERGADDEAFSISGQLTARVIETAPLRKSFHPKAWHFEGPSFGVAFVGSSNLSRMALRQGVEWNLRVDRERDPVAWHRVAESYERLWRQARPLDNAWIDAYAERARLRPWPLPLGEVAAASEVGLPEPTALQRQALVALVQTRAEHRERAIIVMATGLGKTVLAAHDVLQFAGERGKAPTVLWIAHRRELLEQASGTLRLALPSARFGWLLGGKSHGVEFDVLFASVQALSRAGALSRLAADRFDYVVVDEVHHADAPTYRRILSHFSPAFLLGLTATPERADGGDVFGLFDDHVSYRADVGVGIEQQLLVPFRYFGLADVTDYRGVPWRNGRFDVEALSEAVETTARMDKLWEAWNDADKAGSRTMVFCASVRHAEFVRRWLTDRGLRVRLCHAGAGADDRTAALDALERGRVDAICSVDLFNEGVDCRPLDRVVMLRPTESPVLFLQQLGRGLRKADGKTDLVVIDFVGNHAIFLDRVRTLLSLGPGTTSVQQFVAAREAPMPPGCELNLELEAIDLLRRLLPTTRSVGGVAIYRELRAARGTRPTAGELVRQGGNLASFGKVDGGWFGFVRDEGDLAPEEAAAIAAGADWLVEVQSTSMTKCFKMVVLEVLIEADALGVGMALPELARRAHAFLCRSPELAEDLDGVRELGDDPRQASAKAWAAYWRKNPVAAWCNGRWFVVEGDLFRSRVPAATNPALVELTRELVDARLVAYRRRGRGGTESVDVRLFSNGRDAILKLPDGDRRALLPTGDADVRLPDGSPWRFRFAKIAVNVAHPVGQSTNALPDLLRRWFGPHAGQPGTSHSVRFRPSPDGLWIEPLGSVVALAAERKRFVAYPTLRAAAGWTGEDQLDPDAGEVRLPGQVAENQFAVRVSGDSMAGGKTPLYDGDWAIFEWARGLGPGAVEGRVVMVSLGDDEQGASVHIKRLVREDGAFWLKSDNPDVPLRSAQGATILARLLRSVRPESLCPAPGTAVTDVREALSLSEEPTAPYSRVDGHLILLAEGRDVLDAPDRWRLEVPRLGPSETAFVFAREGPDASWTCLGVGRFDADARDWSMSAPPYALWRTLSSGRGASRTLPAQWVAAAERFAATALSTLGTAVLGGDGPALRVVGSSARGGLRIDGGPGGFAERTVSATDIGWVLAAESDVAAHGGLLDEPRVNRLRYLDGTPREATRWIDTGWAIRILGLVGPR